MGGSGQGSKPSKRYPASKKEKKRVSRIMQEFFESMEVDKVEHVEYRDGTIVYLINGIPCVIIVNNIILPHLKCLLRYRSLVMLPRVIVDRGASAAVGRGADLMVPGIRGIKGDFKKDDLVVIFDEEANVPVAVGIAIMDSQEILERLKGERRGKAIKIIHRPGDKIWKSTETL